MGDLGRLPPMNVEFSLHLAAKGTQGSNLHGRNNRLFSECLKRLKQWGMATEEGILEWALEFNHRKFEVPMSAAEVQKTARSAWKCQLEGRNWVGGPSRAMITPEQWARLNPSSLHLYTYIVHKNGWRNGGPFKFYTGAVAETLGWGRTRLNNARGRLIESGDLLAIDIPKQGERRPAILALPTHILKWD